MAQLMPLSLAVSCFSKIQIGFSFLVPAHPGSPGQRAFKRVCVCMCWYKMLPIISTVLCVCWLQLWAVLKWLNRSRCFLLCGWFGGNSSAPRERAILGAPPCGASGSVAEWLACLTQAQKGLRWNHSRGNSKYLFTYSQRCRVTVLANCSLFKLFKLG